MERCTVYHTASVCVFLGQSSFVQCRVSNTNGHISAIRTRVVSTLLSVKTIHSCDDTETNEYGIDNQKQ